MTNLIGSATTRSGVPLHPLPTGYSLDPSSFAPSIITTQYDKQIGFTFTQDFTTLAFNVTAVAQTGPGGSGPSYLLNGLSNMGYWYQIGISYNWGNVGGTSHVFGFQGAYEVFNPAGSSIDPAIGGGALTIAINSGDNVVLSLSFSNNNVVMMIHDWQTGSSASHQYSSFNASYFVGQPNSTNTRGVFTGLMTEQYYTSADNSSGVEVVYSSDIPVSSAWMWMDEFAVIQGTPAFSVFENRTRTAVYYSGQDLQYFSSNGVGLASNGQAFVTGLPEISGPITGASSGPTQFQGQTATLTVRFRNSSTVALTIGDFTITTANGNVYYSNTSSVSLGSGETLDIPIVIMIPSPKVAGSFNVTIGFDWRFYVSSIQRSVRGQSLIYTSSNSVLISNPSTTPTPPSSTVPSSTPGTQKPSSNTSARTNGTSLLRYALPIGIPYLALAGTAAIFVIRRENLRRKPGIRRCPSCRHSTGPSEVQCLICGTRLT